MFRLNDFIVVTILFQLLLTSAVIVNFTIINEVLFLFSVYAMIMTLNFSFIYDGVLDKSFQKYSNIVILLSLIHI